MPSNYIIALAGRGVHYCGMASADSLEELADRAQRCVNMGFEVYIYSLEASPAGPNPLLPKDVLALKRQFHLYDASEEFDEEFKNLVEKLDCHSFTAGKLYLARGIEILQTELQKLTQLSEEAQTAQPTEREIGAKENDRPTTP